MDQNQREIRTGLDGINTRKWSAECASHLVGKDLAACREVVVLFAHILIEVRSSGLKLLVVVVAELNLHNRLDVNVHCSVIEV